MTSTLTSPRTCTYCGQPIDGIARRLRPDHPDCGLVGLDHHGCYATHLTTLLTAAGISAEDTT